MNGIKKLFYRTQGTGSFPPKHQGLHRMILRNDKNNPLKTPYFFKASKQ